MCLWTDKDLISTTSPRSTSTSRFDRQPRQTHVTVCVCVCVCMYVCVCVLSVFIQRHLCMLMCVRVQVRQLRKLVTTIADERDEREAQLEELQRSKQELMESNIQLRSEISRLTKELRDSKQTFNQCYNEVREHTTHAHTTIHAGALSCEQTFDTLATRGWLCLFCHAPVLIAGAERASRSKSCRPGAGVEHACRRVM